MPTRIFTNKVGITTATCIDHIYTNVPELCTDVVSIPVGFSDHNLIAVNKKAKVPKAKANFGTYKRFYKVSAIEKIVGEVKNVDWKDVYCGHYPGDSLDAFMSMLLSIVDKYAPMKNRVIKSNAARWIDSTLKNMMKQRDEAKQVAVITRLLEDRLKYCKLRNQVTKINKRKKKEYYKNRIDSVKYDGKKALACPK